MWIVREGYEGLVRGNNESKAMESSGNPHLSNAAIPDLRGDNRFQALYKSLRFGDGDLLRDGTGDHTHGRTLKGRYIVRVGWDDVRGWFAQVRLAISRKLYHHVLFPAREGHLSGPLDALHSGLTRVVLLLPII